MRIGVEVELHCQDCYKDSYYIKDSSNLDFNIFKESRFLKDIGVKMSEEYYSSTAEFNFLPFEHNDTNWQQVNSWLQAKIKRYNLSLSYCWPAFVWTHIHFFDNSMPNMRMPKKDKLLKSTLRFISENLDCLEKNSLLRLLTSQHLWAYYDDKNLNNEWYRKVDRLWYDVHYYSQSSRRPKYQPVYTSPSTTWGKNKSLEIRLFPNEYLFNGVLKEFLDKVEDWSIYELEPLEVLEFVDIVHNKIQSPRD